MVKMRNKKAKGKSKARPEKSCFVFLAAIMI